MLDYTDMSFSLGCPVGIPATPNTPDLISQSDGEVNLRLSTNHSGVNNYTSDNFLFILHVC